MSDTPIMVQVEGVGKRYRLGVINRQQLTDDFKAWVAKLRGKPDPTIPIGQKVDPQRVGEYFWALKDINFEVRRGEVLGIIGRNGAGKSTLLKLLSRITLPTEGTIRMKGTISSLLEVGTGFHPELSGRDNVYLNGAILGMRREEVDRKMDEIIAFSGIKHHIDTPVKRYSSGMRVRLGFAVAAHLEPDVLIIDEVLSVGDADFQRKSMGKMKDTATSGRTVLFVSHRMAAVRSLCTRTIWLENGRIRMAGDTEAVVSAYLGHYSNLTPAVYWNEADAPANEIARLTHVVARPDNDTEEFRWEDGFEVEVGVVNHTQKPVNVSLQIVDSDDMVILTTGSREGGITEGLPPGAHTVVCRFPPHLFNANDLRINVRVNQGRGRNLRADNAVAFSIMEPVRSGVWYGKRKGAFRLSVPWEALEQTGSPESGTIVQKQFEPESFKASRSSSPGE